MTLREIVELANEGYERATQETLLYYAKPDGTSVDACMGDTLALFIVRELGDVYDSKASDTDNLAEARRVMRRAAKDLTLVADAFDDAWDGLRLIYPMPNGYELLKNGSTCQGTR